MMLDHKFIQTSEIPVHIPLSGKTMTFLITPDSQPSFDIESSGPAATAKRHSGQFSKTVCGMDAAVEPTWTY